ncbi:MAG: hypothetical protein ACRCZF_20380, partial [Gemmataceae bacterium]
AVMAIGAAPAWYFLAYRERFGLFRFYKNGVESVTRHGTQSLSYDQLMTFTANISRVTVNRIYSHTDVLLEFVPQDGTASALTYHTQDRDPDDSISIIREEVSAKIARSWKSQLASGTMVPWCDGLQFHTDGLQLGPKDALVPYAKLESMEIKKGYFRLYSSSGRKPLFEKQVLLPNFFPGLQLLLQLCPGLASETDTETDQ